MSEAKKPSRGDVLAGKYEIEKELGVGMLGTTFLVRSVQSGKHLALKVIHPRLVANVRDRERFKATFDRAREVKHDGLVRLGELGDDRGHLFFTEEYFPSQNLRQLMDEYQSAARPFALVEACQIAVKVAEALAPLHAAGIVHRNLKPENVLVASRNTGPGGKNVVRTVKVTDQGIADVVSPTIFAESYVRRDEAKYLAPELSGFDQDAAPAADVYSIGVMLYELLVGQPPRGTYLSPTQLRGDLPEHIDNVVELAIATTPEDRYPTPADMVADIQRSFSADLDDAPKRPSVKRILAGTAVSVVILGAVGGWFALRDAPDPVLEAAAADDTIRRQVAAQSRTLTEAELNAMVESHPEMLYVPEGPYVKGRLRQEDATGHASQSEVLSKVVPVDGFFIDRFEFPNRLKGKDGQPERATTRMTWQQAADACQALGKRLCSDDEWEKACKGPSNTVYAYGDAYDEVPCGKGVEDARLLGEPQTCVSQYGVWGLSGGVREWTGTLAGAKGNRALVKGGLRANNARGSRCAFAVDESTGYADGTLSFRCCLDASAPAAGAPAAGTPEAGTPAPAEEAAPKP